MFISEPKPLTNAEKQELIKLWGNDGKRKAFLDSYQSWGVWFTQPEMDLTFYKYDLPGGTRLIVMEYMREPYYGEPGYKSGASVTAKKFYVQTGKHFEPSAVNGYRIYDRLKDLKIEMQKELKRDA